MKLLSVLLLSLALSLAATPAAGTAETTSGDQELSLLAINVGKGDALLLRCGSSCYLVDTGKKKQADTLIDILKAEGISRLTGIIITHTDKDHIGGLKKLVNSGIVIGAVYSSAFCAEEDPVHPAEKAVKGSGLKVVYLSAGDSLPLDGGALTVIGPLERDGEKENNNSLVLFAEGGGGSMLLTGDMEFPEETSLLDAGLVPHADVLKIGNHGEDDATSNAFVSAVKPALAVISTNSEEEPDTPSSRVLKLLASYEIPVLITQDAPAGVLVTLKNGKIAFEMK